MCTCDMSAEIQKRDGRARNVAITTVHWIKTMYVALRIREVGRKIRMKGDILTPDGKRNREREIERLALFYVDSDRSNKVFDVPGLSQESVNKVFEWAIILQNLDLADKLLAQYSPSPDQETIDVLFRKVGREGGDPILVHFLQSKASQKEICSEERVFAKSRREYLPQHFVHYLVGFLEHEKLADIQRRNENMVNKARNTVLRGPERLQSLFRDQLWMNGMFFDCVHSQNKYAVLKLLHVTASGTADYRLKPNQVTLNNSFVHCISKGFLSMADLLTGQPNIYHGGYYLGVNQVGFDEAFRAAVESEVLESIQWMLSGRHGLVPSQQVIDEVYRTRKRMPPYVPRRTYGSRAWMQEFHRARQITYHRHVVLESFKHRTSLFMKRSYAQALGIPDAEVEKGLFLDTTVDEELELAAARMDANNHPMLGQNLMRRLGADSSIYDYYSASVNQVDATGAVEHIGDNEDHSMGEGEGIINPDALLAAPPDVPPDVPPNALPDAVPGAAPFPLFGTPAAPPAAAQSRANTLDRLVLECMERRNQGRKLNREQIVERMSELIFQTFSDEQEQNRAVEIVSVGMTEGNIHLLGTTLYFLQSFPPRDVEVWIQGFLVESIVVNSCNPGAMKRIVTGLRGVEDPELNALFRQAEGPNLARIFLTNTFNIYHTVQLQGGVPAVGGAVGEVVGVQVVHEEMVPDQEDVDADEGARVPDEQPGRVNPAVRRATKLAALLVDHGITLTSSLTAVSEVLTHFAREAVAGYGVNVDQFSEEIRVSVESVMDCYEDILLVYVRNEIGNRRVSFS